MYMGSLNKNNLEIINFYSIIWCIITFIEYLIIDNSNISNSNLVGFSWLLVINLLLQLITLYKRGVSLLSFFSVFIVFYYVFHFGQVLLIGLFPDYEYNYLNYVSAYMGDASIFRDTLVLCLVCINMFFIGGLIMKKEKATYNDEVVLQGKNTGLKLIVLLFPFRFILDAIQIVASLIGGYAATFEAASFLPGPVSSLGNMWYACLPLLYLELHSNKAKRNFLIIILSYLALTMVTGNRGHQMVSIVSLFVVMLLEKKTVSRGALLKYAIIAIFGMYFIDIIFDLRQVGLNEFLKDYAITTEETSKSNIILETLGTFGETIYTPFLVIEGYGQSFSPFFGECFIKSIASIVPDVTGAFKDINNEAIFAKMLGTESAIGGSFAGEMYYNFGRLYPLFSFLIGFLFFSVSDKISKDIKLGKYYELLIILPFAVLFVWWIRDSIGNMTRQVVWIAILVYLIKPKKKVVFPRY